MAAAYAYARSSTTSAVPRLTVATLFILALALPVRIWIPLGWFSSFAPIDVLLLTSPVFVALLQPGHFAIGIGRRSIAWLLLAPVVLCVLSYLWTVDAAGTARTLLLDGEAMVAYLAVATIFQKLPSSTIGVLLCILVSTIIATSVLSTLDVPGLAPQVPPNLDAASQQAFLSSYYSRLSHPYFGLSNNLATVLGFFPFLLVAWARITCKARYRWLAAACVVATIATLSRGVVLALAIAWLVWLASGLRRHGKGYWHILPYAALAAIAMAAYIAATQVVDDNLASRLSDANVLQRFAAFGRVLSAVMARPIGYGAGASLAAIAGGDMANAHNAYLQQFLNFGVGGGAIAVLALAWLPIAVKRWRLHSRAALEARGGLLFGILTTLLAFMSEASYEGSVLRVLFYASIGLGVAMVVALEREARVCSEHQSMLKREDTEVGAP